MEFECGMRKEKFVRVRSVGSGVKGTKKIARTSHVIRSAKSWSAFPLPRPGRRLLPQESGVGVKTPMDFIGVAIQ